MPAPFLKLVATTSAGSKNSNVVLAASGPAIYSFDRADGSILSRWSHLAPTPAPQNGNDDNDERPAKRRRLSNNEDEDEDEVSDAPSAEIITNNESAQKPRRKKKKSQPQPSITKLCATSDGKYVIAVTGEDKAVRVLSIEDGRLNQISMRQMPKKPSAITLTPDQSSILVADKFGDVFALPLIEPEEPISTEQPEDQGDEAKPYKPAATSLTVHTRKNLRALENQMKAKQQAQKKTVDFDHRLVLGHVSLLTDILAVVHEVDGKKRNYILTSDRDEHIRISRGIPQTHVIEGFCLGHANFVNRLLIPSANSDFLISGGGDDYLTLWDWLHGREIDRASLLEHVNAVRLSYLKISEEPEKPEKPVQEGSDESKIAVQGLWSVALSPLDSAADIVVTCEAVPALFVFRLERTRLSHHQTIGLEGNPLDVVVSGHDRTILVSIDNVHSPCSSSELAKASGPPFVQTFSLSEDNESWSSGGVLAAFESSVNEVEDWARQFPGTEPELNISVLSDLFYGIEHLRKRGTADADDEG